MRVTLFTRGLITGPDAQPPNVLDKFRDRVKLMRAKMAEFRALCGNVNPTHVEAKIGDARRLHLKDETVDLIFTSPPYATALDYTRGHSLAVAWMQKVLGISLTDYRANSPTYVGSEHGKLSDNIDLIYPLQSELAQSVVAKLTKRSVRHAKLIQRYFSDMHNVFEEMARVLKDGRHAVIVVCPSHIRKVDVPTHEVFMETGRTLKLRPKRCYTRTIYKHRRMLPYLQRAFGKRMSTEYILIFEKM